MSAVGIEVTLLVFLAAPAPARLVAVQVLCRFGRVAQHLSRELVEYTHVLLSPGFSRPGRRADVTDRVGITSREETTLTSRHAETIAYRLDTV